MNPYLIAGASGIVVGLVMRASYFQPQIVGAAGSLGAYAITQKVGPTLTFTACAFGTYYISMALLGGTEAGLGADINNSINQ